MDEGDVIAMVLGAGALIVSIFSLISSHKNAQWQREFEKKKTQWQRESEREKIDESYIKEIDDAIAAPDKFEARNVVHEGYEKSRVNNGEFWQSEPYRSSIMHVTDDFVSIGQRLKGASPRAYDRVLENHASTIITSWKETEGYINSMKQRYRSKKYQPFEDLKDRAEQYKADRKTGT